MDWWQLYLLAVLPKLADVMRTLFGIGLGASIGAFVITCIVRVELEERATGYADAVRLQRFCMPVAFLCAMMVLVSSLIPSERGLMLMLGGYVVTNAEGVGALPENFVGAANAFLERYAESGKGE